MKNRRKFSVFISSTYEDLKEERQALIGVALENNFIKNRKSCRSAQSGRISHRFRFTVIKTVDEP